MGPVVIKILCDANTELLLMTVINYAQFTIGNLTPDSRLVLTRTKLSRLFAQTLIRASLFNELAIELSIIYHMIINEQFIDYYA